MNWSTVNMEYSRKAMREWFPQLHLPPDFDKFSLGKRHATYIMSAEELITNTKQAYKTINETLAQDMMDEGKQLGSSQIPFLLKTIFPLYNPSYDSYTTDAIRDVLKINLSYSHNNYYYLLFVAINRIGSGSYGTTASTTLITEQHQYFMAKVAWDVLNDKSSIDFLGASADDSILIKQTIPDSDAIVLQILSQITELQWFYPKFYTVLVNQTIPDYFDPKHTFTKKPKYNTLIFQEYINGKTIFELINSLDKYTKKRLEFILMSSMRYLYKKVGFVHGDLNPGNILLVKGKYQLPIYDTNTNLIGTIACKYKPVIIDMGIAQTNNFARWDTTVTPFSGEERDAMSIHVIFHEEVTPFKTRWKEMYRAACNFRAIATNVIMENQANITYDQIIDWLDIKVTDKPTQIPTQQAQYTQLKMDPESKTDYITLLDTLKTTLTKPTNSNSLKDLAYSYLFALAEQARSSLINQ